MMKANKDPKPATPEIVKRRKPVKKKSPSVGAVLQASLDEVRKWSEGEPTGVKVTKVRKPAKKNAQAKVS